MVAQPQTRGPDSPNNELPESWGAGRAYTFLVILGGTGSFVIEQGCSSSCDSFFRARLGSDCAGGRALVQGVEPLLLAAKGLFPHGQFRGGISHREQWKSLLPIRVKLD